VLSQQSVLEELMTGTALLGKREPGSLRSWIHPDLNISVGRSSANASAISNNRSSRVRNCCSFGSDASQAMSAGHAYYEMFLHSFDPLLPFDCLLFSPAVTDLLFHFGRIVLA
jgi:hypothetical protein